MSDRVRQDEARVLRTHDLCLWYGAFQALKDVNLGIRQGLVTGLIGPSGCGKTTLLRCFNRINERIPGVRTAGRVEILGHDVYSPQTDLVELRKRVGMVFQRPNPLPLSIAENIVFGLRVHGSGHLADDVAQAAIQEALRAVGLWDELKDRLEREFVLEALRRTSGVQVKAAELLGVSERSLWHRIKKLGISIAKRATT